MSGKRPASSRRTESIAPGSHRSRTAGAGLYARILARARRGFRSARSRRAGRALVRACQPLQQGPRSPSRRLTLFRTNWSVGPPPCSSSSGPVRCRLAEERIRGAPLRSCGTISTYSIAGPPNASRSSNVFVQPSRHEGFAVARWKRWLRRSRSSPQMLRRPTLFATLAG